MKKTGILNAELMKEIAALGHMDLFLIGDAGMPIPKGIKIIDLALCKGIPSFEQVLDAVLKETEIEYYYIAEEICENNQRLFSFIRTTMPKVESEMLPHHDLKMMTEKCKFAIRTGEFSPYPNLVLRAGVTFSSSGGSV